MVEPWAKGSQSQVSDKAVLLPHSGSKPHLMETNSSRVELYSWDLGGTIYFHASSQIQDKSKRSYRIPESKIKYHLYYY